MLKKKDDMEDIVSIIEELIEHTCNVASLAFKDSSASYTILTSVSINILRQLIVDLHGDSRKIYVENLIFLLEDALNEKKITVQ